MTTIVKAQVREMFLLLIRHNLSFDKVMTAETAQAMDGMETPPNAPVI